jgi:hypothetical protein
MMSVHAMVFIVLCWRHLDLNVRNEVLLGDSTSSTYRLLDVAHREGATFQI